MSRISSALDTSYAYLGTEIDSNSDGVLSRRSVRLMRSRGSRLVVSQSQGTQEAPKSWRMASLHS